MFATLLYFVTMMISLQLMKIIINIMIVVIIIIIITILTFQPLIVCRYFIYGMQDSQNLERVVLAFDKFDIPYGRMDR